MEFEVPKRHILRPTLSTSMVQRLLQWERQKRCSGRKKQGPMAEQYRNNKASMNLFIFVGREDEDKRRQRNCQTWIFFSKSALFGHILNKSTHSLFGAWSFLLVHIRFTPSEGPKGFVNWSYKKSDHESWTIKSDRGKKAIFHGPWCKAALMTSSLKKWSDVKLGQVS